MALSLRKLPRESVTRRRTRFVGKCQSNSARRRNHSHLTPSQLSRKRRQSAGLTLCPSVLDRNILTLDEACFAQPLLKGRHEARISSAT